MNVRVKQSGRAIVLTLIVLLASTAAFAMGDVSDKSADRPDSMAAVPPVLSPSAVPLKERNLLIFARSLWLVLRYDGQAGTLVATVSDKDGAALWFARSVQAIEDTAQDTLTLKAVAVLKSGSRVWVDWQEFDIEIDGSGNAQIVKTNPNGTHTYSGKALKIKTYSDLDS